MGLLGSKVLTAAPDSDTTAQVESGLAGLVFTFGKRLTVALALWH